MTATDWTDEKPATPSDFKVGKYGLPEQRDIEAMLVGYLLFSPNMYETLAEREKAKKEGRNAADKMVDAGLDGKMFETPELQEMFDHLFAHYRKKRELINVDDAGLLCLNAGQDRQEAANYRLMVTECLAAKCVRDAKIDLLIDAVMDRHMQKAGDDAYRKFVEDRANPAIGPKKAAANYKDAVIRNVADSHGGMVEACDWGSDCQSTIDWLKDMKESPEKYRGWKCGIDPIDSKTQGFSPGQLTIFVGAHGGFKTTTMINVAYGLWERGRNVLYVSIEMPKDLMCLKMECCMTGLSYAKLWSMMKMSEPEDRIRLKDVENRLVGTNLSKDEVEKLEKERLRLAEVLKETAEGDEDSVVIKREHARRASRKNKLEVVKFDSSKIKLSHLEKWLDEHEADFKPDVVVIDYLDLCEPEVPTPDRTDIGLGDVCKAMRAMGNRRHLSVITAAQMKRSAWERLRKFGIDNPEKSQLDTDDISGSHMIGGDADNVFFLWADLSRTKLRILTAKSRYGEKDNTKGETVQVDADLCRIGTNLDDIKTQTLQRGMGDAMAVDAAKFSSRPKAPFQEGGGVFADAAPDGDLDMDSDRGSEQESDF